MAFLNKETGELTFADGLRLCPGLALGELNERLGGRADAVVRLESHEVAGGRLIPVCTVQGGALQSVTLCLSSASSRPVRKTGRQRAFLAARLDIADPCPDQPLCVRCPFGELFLSADPYTGRAEARVLYAACSDEGGNHVPFTDPE